MSSATKPSISAKQLRANRRNAKQSTGPRTEEGKSRAAMNARVHGIFCKDLLLPGEDPQEFEPFRDLLLAGLEPRDFLERSMAEQYVEAKWRIRRVREAERDAHEVLAGHIEFDQGRSFLDLRRRLRDLPRLESLGPGDPDPRPRGGDPAVREAMREQRYADRRALVPVSTTMAESFVTLGEGAFERMGRYEHRLEMSADRALRQLRQLRKDRGPDWTPPTEIADDETTPEPAGVVASAATSRNDDNAPVQNEQNEPIFDATTASPDAPTTCEADRCNDSRAMTPEIFHPARLGTPDVIAEATTPRAKPRRR